MAHFETLVNDGFSVHETIPYTHKSNEIHDIIILEGE